MMLVTVAPTLAADGNPVVGVAMWPVKAVGMTTAAVVGTPIAVTRYVAKESVASTKKVAGDSGNPMMLGAASLIGVPVGLVVGSVEGMYYGTYNSYKNPFNKDAFSLGEIE
jgi:hypothetical protein